MQTGDYNPPPAGIMFRPVAFRLITSAEPIDRECQSPEHSPDKQRRSLDHCAHHMFIFLSGLRWVGNTGPQLDPSGSSGLDPDIGFYKKSQ
jgi:hypothetical protein